MDVTFYSDVNHFCELCFPFLSVKEAENNLIIGLLGNLRKDIQMYGSDKPILVTVTEGITIKLVSIRTPPFNLILSHTDDLNTIPLLVKEFKNHEMELPGVSGFKAGAFKFAQLWTEKKKSKYLLEMQQRIYRLDKVNTKTLGHYPFRVATVSDKTLVLKWVRNFILEAFPDSTDEEVQGSQERTNQAIEQKLVYVLEKDNKIVSIARRTGPTPHGERVALVYTPPNERRKGYATEVVAKLSQLILDEGKHYCFLFTDLMNPTSNKIYQEVGYRPVIDTDVYRFENQEE